MINKPYNQSTPRPIDPMRIAYLHYHLKTGGVTSVIRRQLDAVKNDCSALVFAGLPPEAPFPAPVVHIPGLAYDTEREAPSDPERVAGEILKSLEKRWPGGCDLLHVHNPTLAKNRSLLEILKRLSDAGIRLLCQVHDFAEDGRPHLYFDGPYPEDCHWATINARDRRILLSAGLRSEGVHLLANTVKPLPRGPAQGRSGAGHVLYPVRAIRRKNIGEAILVSLFLPPETPVLVTQPANSPQDLQSMQDWGRFVRENGLNVRLEAGVGADFARLVQESRFLLSTSITEGFGFSFLEAWTAGKLLWGRKLSDICMDFEENGLWLDHLYTRISVPVDRLQGSRVQKRWVDCFVRAHRRFLLPLSEKEAQRAWQSVTAGGTVDFGLLDEAAQRSVIRSASEKPAARREIAAANPFLQHPGRVQNAAALIEHNRNIVLDRYDPEGYRRRLTDVYRKAANLSVRHRVDKAAVLSAFLSPERFSLLKWCAYDPAK